MNFTARLLIVFGLAFAWPGPLRGEEPKQAEPDELQAEVSEVNGHYAKVALADAKLEKGDAAELIRPDASEEEPPRGSVTAVQPEYVVVKFAGVEPKQGDTIRFLPNEKASRKSNRESSKERRERLAAERKQKEEEARQKWLARLEARGIEAWEPPTDEQHAEALARYKQRGEEVHALLPSVQLYETKYFLFYTNIPPGQVAPYIAYLDAMYAMMARLFGVAEGQDVWLGRKAPVFAFLTQEQFLGFEQKYYQMQPVGAYGICHQSPGSGEVVIACYRGNDPHDFGQMLVHETSHGFVFRYKTKANLPVWVDEGMAEYIGEQMVPKSTAVRNKEKSALAQLKQTGSLGGNFFEKEAQLAAWQYGVATSLNKFLIASGQKQYVAFIEGMKEGLPWQEAIQQAYSASPEQVLFQFSRAVGVPGLRL